MRLDNRIGIVKEQPGRPELGAEVVTLRLELARQAAIQDNRTDRKCVSKGGAHPPNLRTRRSRRRVPEEPVVDRQGRCVLRPTAGDPRDLPVATRIVQPSSSDEQAVGSKSCTSAKLSHSRNAFSSSVWSSAGVRARMRAVYVARIPEGGHSPRGLKTSSPASATTS